jgi:hypothetical protein
LPTVNGRRVTLIVLSSLVLAATSGCAWVKLTPGGEKIRVLAAEEVGACHRLGKTTATTRTAVLGVGRSYLDVAEELQKLARNAAYDMNGDSIVPEGGIEDGRQTFVVYRCIGSVGRSSADTDSRSGGAVTRPLPP